MEEGFHERLQGGMVMQWDTQMIKKLITMIGFVPQNGKNCIYCKTYASHGGYMVLVDFNQRAITYVGYKSRGFCY